MRYGHTARHLKFVPWRYRLKHAVPSVYYAAESGKKIPIAKMRLKTAGDHTVETGYLFHTSESTSSPTAGMSLEGDTLDLCVGGEKHTLFLGGSAA